MEITAHCIQVLCYWFFYIFGVLPVSYKMTEKYLKLHTCTWTINKIGINFCFIHILIIFVHIIFILSSYTGNFELFFNTETLVLIMRNLMQLAIMCMVMMNIVIMVVRRKKMEKLLNDINKLYTRVLIKTDKSQLKGTWLCASPIITYFILILTIKVTSMHIYGRSTLTSARATYEFLIMYWYDTTTYCSELLAAIIFVSLEIIIEGVRFGMKIDLPSVSRDDWKCWTDERNYVNTDKVDIKVSINEYREICQDLNRIIDIANWMFDFQLFVTFTYNQVTCVIYAFTVIYLITRRTEFDGSLNLPIIFFSINCIAVTLRNIYLCHRGEQVTAKAKQLFVDAALVDSSKIDDESKLQLINFLRELNEANFRVSVMNVFFLDYRQMFLVLSFTSTYILIILQYMGLPR